MKEETGLVVHKNKAGPSRSPSMGGLSDWSVVKLRFMTQDSQEELFREEACRALALMIFFRSRVPPYRHFSITPWRSETVRAALFIYLLSCILRFTEPKMLGLCLYVPVSNSDTFEVEYFESNGLPSELKSLFNKLSVFLPSQEFSSYKRWRKVRKNFPVIVSYLNTQSV